MKPNNDLLEQYEDAVFAILMDQVAHAEGQWALEENRRLKEDPAAAVPDTVTQRCRRRIQKARYAKNTKASAGVLRKGIHIAAVVVLLLAATMTISFAAFPTLRINVLNTILEVYETHTEFSYGEEKTTAPKFEITARWIPEGFVLTEDGSNSVCSWKTFENSDGAVIHIEKSLPVTITVDTENAEVDEIQIQGYSGTIITKNYEARVIWLNEKEDIVYFVNTEWLSADMMLQIAEHVK